MHAGLDLLTFELIIGSAIAVERIFSGGRDLISIRQASLCPDTICVLMIVKQSIWAQRNQVKA
jgi:hypothetical protein